MERKTYDVLILNNEVKRIKIACRCGAETVEELPAFMDRISEMQVIINCKSCGQPYGSAMGKVARLDRHTYMPEKMLGQVQHAQSAEDVEAKLRAEGKNFQPGSKVVN